jgi:uridine phosphorylase
LNVKSGMAKPPMPDAIIIPKKTARSPFPGETVIMVSSGSDLENVIAMLPGTPGPRRSLMMSRLATAQLEGDRRIGVIGPVVGAPYAVLLLENLLAWGARRVIYFGWCGAVAPDLAIGDAVLVTGALADEGCSRHYGHTQDTVIAAPGTLHARIGRYLEGRIDACRPATVWTTDAVFRETPERVRAFQEDGIAAVEMELSAVYATAAYRGAEAAGALVVSDSLADLTWRPGFSSERFKSRRRTLARLLVDFARTDAQPVKAPLIS